MRAGVIIPLLLVLGARAQVTGELERAIAMEQSGATDKAIALLQSLLKRDPQSAEAHNWLGVAYLEKNSLNDAEAEFRQAIRLKPGYVRAYNNLGSTLAQAGDIEQGIRFLNEGLKYAPGDLQLRINLGMALRSKGDAEGALAHFRSLLKEYSDSPELHYQYGQTLRQQGDIEGAIQAFEAALALDPESQEAYYGLGQALKQSVGKSKRVTAPESASLSLKSGTEALARNDFVHARDAAQQAIDAGAATAEAYYLLGFAQWFSGDHGKAAASLDESLRLNPAAAEVYSFRGVTLRDSGELDAARRTLQRAIALDPKRPLPYMDLALVFLRQDKLEEAIAQFEAGLNLPAPQRGLPDLDAAARELRRAIAKKPDNARAYTVLGRLLGAAGASAPEVTAAFERAIALKPDDAETRNALGLVYVQTGDDEKAVAAFRAAIKLRPDYADAHQNLGAVLTTSDVDEAVRELETAIRLQPALLKAKYNLAIAYDASPRYGAVKGIETIRALLSAEPKYPRAEFVLGRLLLRQSKVEEATEHLRRAVDQEPENGEARYQLGLALSRAGRKEEGAEEIRKSRELIAANENKRAAALDLEEAKAALLNGDNATAAAKARKVLAFDPSANEAQFVLNSALPKADTSPRQHVEQLIRDGKFADAEAVLRTYLQAEPKSAWGWYALGYSLYGQRKIGDSIQALAKSLDLDRGNADAHKVLGRVLMMIGRFDAAKLEFEQGKRLDPKSAEMPYNLGKLFSIQDNWPDARREFEAALRIDPAYMEAYDGLGFALESLGDEEGATANYKKSIELCESRHANFASPYVNLSALSNRAGKSEVALEYARKALQVNPNSDRALFQIAKANEYLGDLKGAAEALDRAVAINGRASSYYYVLATINRKLGKTEESRQAMEKFVKLDRESNELEQKRREFLKDERPDGSPHQ